MSVPGMPADTLALRNILDRVLADWRAQMPLPRATYRLQFNRQFTFANAERIVPYLAELGISHAYASPYLKARPGSMHGYDIINHRLLNPEIGTDEEFARWVHVLRSHGMCHIADIVPNHMGIVGNDNPWWNDILENGLSSPFGRFFDIDWHASPRPQLRQKVLLPILGDPYGKVLEAGQLKLDLAEGAFFLFYFEHRFPIAPQTYGLILRNALPELQEKLATDAPSLLEYQSILTAITHLPSLAETEPEKVAESQREKEVIKRRLAALVGSDEIVRAAMQNALSMMNGRVGDRHSFDPLDQLLEQQPYRLSFWRVAADEINYRRFFDVNELAALSMEQGDVFAATHEKILALLADNMLAGLRVDHPDGLYDPQQYLRRLQTRFLLAKARPLLQELPEFAGVEVKEIDHAFLDFVDHLPGEDAASAPPLYVLVEKILGDSEQLPDDWQTHGTTGYDFLNMLNGVFVDASHARDFTRLYQDWIQDDSPFHEFAFQKKFLTLQVAMSSELHMLAHQLDRLAQKYRWSRDFTLTTLRHVLREIIASFPVYRTYITSDPVRDTDRKVVLQAIKRALYRNPALSTAAFHFVRDMLLLKYPDGATDADREEQRRFVGKFQQVTAPVMAKGVEDTAFYVYNRLLSLNEVGGNPARFGVAPGQLHQYFQARQARWPHALSSTSTHDTKRSEDVRARLNVLSEWPEAWNEKLWHWNDLNKELRVAVDDVLVPDANEEYFLYQSLLGAWPLEESLLPTEHEVIVQRIQAYMMKALHEAKVHTSWINPNQAYDEAVQQFVARILEPHSAFLRDFLPFQQKLARLGIYNSLAQTLIKFTAPGVPDVYQGTEVFDFSLVDPDNRRPVDFAHRQALLAAIKSFEEGLREMMQRPADGRAKLFVTQRSLQVRKEHPELFTVGAYRPLEVIGAQKDHVFAFAREHDRQRAIVVAPRLVAGLLGDKPLSADLWGDTSVVLPGPVKLRHVFSGHIQNHEGYLPLARLLNVFPVFLGIEINDS